MTVAIVKNGVVIKIADKGYYMDGEWNRPIVVTKEHGFYEFIETPVSPPEGKKKQSTAYAIDDSAGTVTEAHTYVDMTTSEIKAATNDPLDAQIKSLEQQAVEQGLLRTLMEDLQERALVKASAAGVTEADLLNPDSEFFSVPYKKLSDNVTARSAIRVRRV